MPPVEHEQTKRPVTPRSGSTAAEDPSALSDSDPEPPANGRVLVAAPPSGPQALRDETVRLRHETAELRDRAAAARDRVAVQAQEQLVHDERAREASLRAFLSASAMSRELAAADRAAAAHDRRLAAADRARHSDRTSCHRDETGDTPCHCHEQAAARDLAADARDQAAQHHAAVLLAAEASCDSALRLPLSGDRTAGRDQAAADRAAAALDRELAAADRLQARLDDGEVRMELEQAQLDGLTGAHRLDLGRLALQREIDRARRSDEPFVLGFIDVDGLKELNDREGHAAGDALLAAVVGALRSELRSYDPIVRVGGDEFLCGFTNTELEAATRRVREIRASLERGPTGASISVGLATLGERDTLEKLIARSDADMYAGKQRGRTAPE